MLSAVLSSCGTQRQAVSTVYRDSVQVQVQTKIEWRTDTVFFEIPAQTAQRETRDSVSHLENDIAFSDARVNADGSLFHSLNIKKQKKQKEVSTPIIYKDSVRTEYEYIEVKEPQYIEKELSKAQRFKLRAFPFLLLAIAAMLCYRYRKNIISIILRLIK